MSQPFSLSTERVLPTQVWLQLNTDHQLKIMRLLMQLSFNLVLAQSEPLVELQEANHVISAHYPQNPA